MSTKSSSPTALPVVIEVPKGSKNKYELDKETGLLRLDRVLYSAVHYPADYGFVPRSYCDDGDPLDALVLGQEPVVPLCLVEARPVAVMRMRDDKGIDDKIIAVNARDPYFAEVRATSPTCPKHTLREMKRFFRGLQNSREQGSRGGRVPWDSTTRWKSCASRSVCIASFGVAK